MIVCPFKDLGRYAPVLPGLEEAVKVAEGLTDLTPRTIPLSDGNRIMIVAGTSRSPVNALSEAHRNYLDLQYIVKGEETVGWAPLDTLEVAEEYNAEKDISMHAGPVEFVRIPAGHCYVVYPEDGHMPGVQLDEPHDFVKLVVKLKV